MITHCAPAGARELSRSRSRYGIAHAVGGVADHVHVFAGLKATHCLADVMRDLKSESTGWIHRELKMPWFATQEGYGGFTVSASSMKAYVLNQPEHNCTKSSPDEYLGMLRRCMVAYDERYLFVVMPAHAHP